MNTEALPIIVLCGPTAVGKTALAVELALDIGGEVVGADSRQVYRGMDVGTAKPTAVERARVRHHVVDLVDPTEEFDVGRFRVLAHEAIADIQARGLVPLVVGGSGFYVRALLAGLPDLPAPEPEVRASVRSELAMLGSGALHDQLRIVDPVSAKRLHRNDAVRVARAIEVHRQTGRALSSFSVDRPMSGRILRIVIDRSPEELDARIQERVRAMWSAGFLAEVAALRSGGLPPTVQAMNALGYREVWDHLVSGRSVSGGEAEATVVRIARATRQFVRRQRAWFRAEPGQLVRHPDRDHDAIARCVSEWISSPVDRSPE